MIMNTSILNKSGKIEIPESIRTAHAWQAGQKFSVTETAEGVLLKPVSPFPETKLEEVAGCMKYRGKPKTLEKISKFSGPGTRPKKRTLGKLKGKISLPDDFLDESEEINKLFYGDDEQTGLTN
jgi:bifunctional DNA-binding transcriptional regulator/antitoxin component of YhaV-PrlF toxin-antitoxin module